jgi:hypothetical protein
MNWLLSGNWSIDELIIICLPAMQSIAFAGGIIDYWSIGHSSV